MSPTPLQAWRLRASLVVVLGIVVALMAGCSTSKPPAEGAAGGKPGGGQGGKSSSGKPSSSESTAKPPPAPQEDQCRNLTFGDINRYSNSTEPSSCSQPHTSYTFAVATLPKDVAFSGVDIGNDAVQEAASLECRSRFVPFIGGSTATRTLSRLSVTYFLPEQEGFDAGARWIRCDVIALRSDRVLAELPSPLEKFNSSSDALDDFGLCSRGDPGSSEGLLLMCNQSHTYRAVAALRLGAEDASYPGESVTKDDGSQRCDDFVSDLLGVGGGYSYAWTYPSSEDWDNGQRFGYCWNKTSG